MDITDQSPMTFGKHAGKAMANVPATYLLYIFDKGWVTDPDVKRYIMDNMQALKAEVSKTPRR